MLTGILGFIGNFIVDHWIGLAVVGGILTSTGAAGAAGSKARDSTEKFLEDQLEKRRKEEEES